MKLLLLLSLVFSQQQITDTNFYGAIYQGKFIVDGDSAHMGTQMMIIPSTKVPSTVRKLRLRNFPSVVLFKNGKKVKVWKADFDGKLELTTEDVKKAIEWYSR